MPSTYPGALDSWPGSPYVDGTEYMDASYANYWISAMTAIETTIGYGSGSTSANPLYSTTYGLTYATVTARIAAIEAAVVGSSKINTAAGNIGPISTTATAGSTGLAADAGHGHQGVLRVLAGSNITVTSTDSAGHGTVTIAAANAGVSSVIAGAGITVSGSTGNVTITATGSQPNGTTGNVQPVGTADAAGSTGNLADAGHIHQGVTSIASTGYGTNVSTTDGVGHGAATVGVSLTYTAGVLSTNAYPTSSFTTFLTSGATLGVGQWLISFSTFVQPPAIATGYITIIPAAGSGSMSFAGPQVCEAWFTTSNIPFTIGFTTTAIVTVAGTLAFKALCGNGTGGIIYASTIYSGQANATGFTALRIQ